MTSWGFACSPTGSRGSRTATPATSDAGVETLARARDGFLEQGATWEAARTDVAIAEALSGTELNDGQRDRLANAVDLFERLGSVAELRRARAVIPA